MQVSAGTSAVAEAVDAWARARTDLDRIAPPHAQRPPALRADRRSRTLVDEAPAVRAHGGHRASRGRRRVPARGAGVIRRLLPVHLRDPGCPRWFPAHPLRARSRAATV